MGAVKARPRYSWKPGKRFALRAEVVARSLDRIRRDSGGAVNPAAVVDAARDEGHPLHAAFVWDDTVAAERYRLAQARELIHSVRVVLAGGGEPQLAYVSVTVRGTDARGYVPARVALTEADYHAQSLREALAALEGFRRRYAHLTELAEVFGVIDRLGDAG
jgi:hypothetical protein